VLLGLSAAVWRLGVAQSFHSSDASSFGQPVQDTA
jgi:hypothetical protein